MPRTPSTAFIAEKNKEENEPLLLYSVYDYDSGRSSSVATGTLTDHLIDGTASFTADDVAKARTIHNTIDKTYAQIIAVNSPIDVTLSADIMTGGETYDLESNLYFIKYESNITYKGIIYIQFPISHQGIGENTTGRIDSMNINLSNVSRLIQSYFEAYDFGGKKVEILTVFKNLLNDDDAYTIDAYYIDSYTANAFDASFTLTSKYDILSLMIPKRKYERNFCGSLFKGPEGECGYVGAETECDRSLQRCRELGNQSRWGGFASIPAKGRRPIVG